MLLGSLPAIESQSNVPTRILSAFGSQFDSFYFSFLPCLGRRFACHTHNYKHSNPHRYTHTYRQTESSTFYTKFMPSLVVSITARRHFIFMTNNSSGSRAASRGVPRPLGLRQNSCRQCRRRRQRQQCDGDGSDGSNDLFFGTIRSKKDKKYLFGSKLNENIYAKHTHTHTYTEYLALCVCYKENL